MDIGTFVWWAQRYSDMGWSVQQQFTDYVAFGNDDNLNPNAVREIQKFITEMGQRTDVDTSGFEED